MDLEEINNDSINVLKDVCSLIESAREYAYQSVNISLVESCFQMELLGRIELPTYRLRICCSTN